MAYSLTNMSQKLLELDNHC